VGVVLLTQQFHKNLYRQKLQAEELKNIHQSELPRSSIQVQEDERKRIAQDMHDELGAILSITKMHLQQLEEKEKNNTGELLPALQNIRSLTETSLASMRRVSHELMPQQLESFGLVKTLEAVAAQANKTGSIEVNIVTAANLPELSWPVKLGLYRMVMELINNTLKHAGANNILVQLKATANDITCTYTDDGTGLKHHDSGDGLGHKSIEGRAKALDGTVCFNNTGNGFEAVIRIPF
jgi:signal transduction histidine kinase